uniref:Protein kinase domain-containing protein n=1 Tax=Rhizophagus irregularis (strain DAOM 181602 / DAOM 197198 / MUCL 43194) TaxID=747089 RepID=U9TMG5_RHIID
MEEYRISDDVYEQIKDFSWLTEEQDLLVDKLILNKEIKERYIKFRLCKGCKQPKSAADCNRWKRDRSQRVVLKYIYNSQDNIAEFLREVESHVIANECGSVGVIRCYGIAKNPETNEYMMIMEQGMNGSLRHIHKRGLIHHDFHSGNIINIANAKVSVTDLGLCRPLDAQNNDVTLAIKICQGLRPKSNYKIPQLILDIINQYWDGDSLKRPTADEMAAWNFDNNCWERYGRRVVLKCIHNSQDNIAELLKEAESHVE